MADEPVVAEAVEVEEAGPNRIWILPESISRERLSELRIRIMDEQEFSVTLEGQTAPIAVKVWGVSDRAKRKLQDVGYTLTIDDDTELKLKILVLTNPDGGLAKAGVDPRTIKIVKFENAGMQANIQAWFREAILAKLSPVINSPIIVSGGTGNNSFVLATDGQSKFQIGLGTSPIMQGNGYLSAPPRAWGVDTSSLSNTHCDVWYGGTPIVSDEGAELGAMNDHNICIYWRVDGMQSVEDSKRVLTNILDAALRIRANPGAFTTPEAIVKANYVKACSSRLVTEQQALAKEVEQRQQEVIKLGDQLIESTRRGASARASLSGFDIYAKDMNNRLEAEFAGLKQMGHVVDVSWRGNCLVVTTDNFYIIDPRTKIEHDVGCFQILLDHRRAKPYMFNLTRRVDGMSAQMHHPHVFAAGEPCLGNMGEALPVALAQYQWTVVVQLCLVFLQHVNVDDDAGRQCNKWPISERFKLAEEEKKAAAAAALAAKETANVPAA